MISVIVSQFFVLIMWKAQFIVLNQNWYNDVNLGVYKFYSNIEAVLKYVQMFPFHATKKLYFMLRTCVKLSCVQ